MVVGEASINNIMGGIESTGGVRLHNHKRKLKQRFDIIKKLGQGTYGKVQLGINKETGQEVAIKTIKKSKIETEADLIRIRREIQIMSSVQHPNIIHIYEVFENREKMVLVMEYAAGGELYDYLSERKVLIEEEARRIFRQIATACYYCHKHKICHRDLKLENILLDENGNAKIADFGLSNVFDDQRLLSTFCGSPLYASPEIVKGTPYHGPEVDCWSLGVLLYTLVYGAMPFDGSNFKRLVKQISQGDYFEPKKPSPASPLIKEMLTVNPRNRANISKICAHWWVNETYDESCLDISEELANQTPVRLDLLLSLAPPPPQLESDKLVVTGDMPEEPTKEAAAPTRSQSVGSLMELQTPAERRIKELISDELKASPKRKLESTVSTDQVNLLNDGKRKDKIVKENTVADISVHGFKQSELQKDISMSEAIPLDKSRTQTLSKEMEMETSEELSDPQLQGAACAEILEEAKKNEIKKPTKLKKTTSSLGNKILEEINENPSQENVPNNVNKENEEEKQEVEEKEPENKTPTKRKTVKKVLGVKNENAAKKEKTEEPVSLQSVLQKNEAKPESDKKENQTETKPEQTNEEAPSKPIERRRSRIFEQAEKFQNMITANESKTTVPEKPKKLVIPGVSVGGFKKEFERKASLTSTSPPKLKGALIKKTTIDKPVEKPEPEIKKPEENEKENVVEVEEDRKIKLKNAVSIISNALDKEGTRKSKSRPCMSRKPPVPFGASGRSASGSIGMITSPLSPQGHPSIQSEIAPKSAPVEVSTPTQVKFQQEPEIENKTSSAEITLKSATLPRRKTTKAEIKLDYPQPKPPTIGFKTEMAHHIEAPPKLTTQRSEVIFPVSAAPNVGFRASSVEPEKTKSKERIIPISFDKNEEKKETLQSPPTKPPMPRTFQSQKSNMSQRTNSLSRQSTQDSDVESNVSGDPIRKSPREYIIPIAVEGGGYVTPRAGSLEPSESGSTTSTLTNNSRRNNTFTRARRMNSILSDRDGSEDESPFGALHRHSSFGKDSDTEDSRKDMFHMHRLRSSRPMKATMEHNDSVSSGEDDDDDGFEILTAENLFSTLLSRVRDLSQRLNVDNRPGFPTSRLLSHFGHETDFFNNMHSRLTPSRSSPLGRAFSRERNTSSSTSSFGPATPWRRSVSRDLATDIDRVFNEESSTPTHTATLPRGDKKTKNENLNLADLDLKRLKLSEEDALALSYLTPGLSRRIQKQLLAQLPPSEARKLTRTLSMRNPNEKQSEDSKVQRRSVDRISSTLPRRLSVDNSAVKYGSQQNLATKNEDNKEKTENVDKLSKEIKNIRSRENTPASNEKSFLPVKSLSPNNDRSVTNLIRPRAMRSASVREPKSDYLLKLESRSLKSPEIEGYSYKNDDSFVKSDSLSDYSSKLSNIYNSPGSRSSSYSLYAPETSTLNKYLTPKYNEEKKTEIKRPSVTRKISRFLRPDFFDGPKEENIVQKEKKEKEMETQQVLKEIRDKRIKNKLNLRRERSASREAAVTDNKNISKKLEKSIEEKKFEEAEQATKKVSDMLKSVTENIKKLEANVSKVPEDINESFNEDSNKQILHDYVNLRETTPMHDYVNVKSPTNTPEPEISNKTQRTSKLIRPKSYPSENSSKNTSPEKESKLKKVKVKKNLPTQKSIEKVPKPKTSPESEPKSNRNKFLLSIEKKLRSFSGVPNGNSREETRKNAEKKSSVETAIKRLREQSLPRNIDHCITESGLIKRAVSVEDITSLGNKTLQPSRKSVTKILGLFKKYEEREKKPEKNKTKIEGNNKKTEETEKNTKLERPKSLMLDKLKLQNGTNEKEKPKSKLPVNSFRRSLNLDTTVVDSPKSSKTNGERLKLDLKTTKPNSNDENRNSLTTTDDSSVIISPCDDISDTWSIASDFHRDITSPISLSSHLYSGDESESVIDRIRRKSFYSRFNEKKRPRKPSLTYKDLDLYKDTNRKSNYKIDLDHPTDYKSLDRRISYDYADHLKRDQRSSSLLHDGYVNMPQRYQTYNPRMSKRASSLYGTDNDRHQMNDAATTEKSRKYSYQSQQSKNSTRLSISPTRGASGLPNTIPSNSQSPVNMS